MTLSPRPAEKEGRTLDPGPRLEPRALPEQDKYWLQAAIADFRKPQVLYEFLHGYWVDLVRAGYQENYAKMHLERAIDAIKAQEPVN